MDRENTGRSRWAVLFLHVAQFNAKISTMHEDDRDWMTYIDGEVRAVCEAKGCGHQIRRSRLVREKPVSESTIDDYEWKLIPNSRGRPPDALAGDFDGVYYVLSFDKANNRFVVQHDTAHCGMWSHNWEVTTCSEIQFNILRMTRDERGAISDHPPVGWLRDHLLNLITRFGPNHFSIT
jgi:hypothetical protein